jgi:hypothetical protein
MIGRTLTIHMITVVELRSDMMIIPRKIIISRRIINDIISLNSLFIVAWTLLLMKKKMIY